MKARYTNTKTIDTNPTKLQRLFKLTLYIGAACMAIAATLTIIAFLRADKDNSEALPQFPYGTLTELTDPDTFLSAYLSVNCGGELMESTQTIRVTGQMDNGDNSHTFTLIRKRPDKMLFTIDLGANQMTIGANGNTVWQRIRTPEREDQHALIEGEEAKKWLDQRRFFDRIISTTLGDGTLTAIETTRWDAKDCLQVTAQNTDGVRVTMLVDPQTMYPIAELQPSPGGNTKQTLFSDYRDIGGMPIPFKMDSSAGNNQSRIQLHQASLNSGVLSKLFEVPEALVAQ